MTTPRTVLVRDAAGRRRRELGPSAGGKMSRRSVAAVALTLAVFSTALALALLVLARLNGLSAVEMLTGQTGFSVAFGIVFPLVGAFLARRLSRNPVGWILIGIGLSQTVALFAGNYGEYAAAHPPVPVRPGVVLLGEVIWVLALPLGALLLLLYPHGRLPSRRWRPVVWAVATGVAVMVLAVALDWNRWVAEYATGTETATTPLPELLGGLGFAILVGSWVVALGGLILRFRRSTGVERQQLKWFTYAAGVVAATFLVTDLLGPLGSVLTLVSVVVLPGAIALAVLRYRLYDIDRVISRTVSYAALTGLLVAVYAGSVVGLGGLIRALGGAGDGDLVVAASTLGVAATFGPLRARIQRFVDHRFNRARYDAAWEVERFGGRLRDEVDLDGLTHDALGTVWGTVQPSHASLWLARPRGSR